MVRSLLATPRGDHGREQRRSRSSEEPLTCPRTNLILLSVMNNKTVINRYVEALRIRAHQQGGVNYMSGVLLATLEAMKLQGYELDVLKQDIKSLEKLNQEVEDRRDERLKRIMANKTSKDRTYPIDWVMASR